MKIDKVMTKSKKMIEEFINELGLDGKYYADMCNCPIRFDIPIDAQEGSLGQYLEPTSEDLIKILKNYYFDIDTLKEILTKGLIIINPQLNIDENNDELLTTIIHETFHSNRNILLYDAVRDDENGNAYSYQNGRLNQNTFNYGFTYVDASQDIIKGSIDNCNNTIYKFNNIINENPYEDFEDDNILLKSDIQYLFDEALVELMSILCYSIKYRKEQGKDYKLPSTISRIAQKVPEDEIILMSKIIDRHEDFELFKWMIDPIEYTNGDLHYDFFEEYTKNDQDLINKLHKFYNIQIKKRTR